MKLIGTMTESAKTQLDVNENKFDLQLCRFHVKNVCLGREKLWFDRKQSIGE